MITTPNGPRAVFAGAAIVASGRALLTCLVFALGLLFASIVQAQVVLSCNSSWGASGGCGGCSGVVWKTPAPTVEVKTDASQYWVHLSTLKPTDTVFTHPTKKNGDAATCGEAVATTVAALTGSPAIPPATPPVPPTVPPTASFPVTCTAPTTRTDGTPVTALTYTFVVNGVDYPVGNICRYDPVNPVPGTYTISVKAQDSSGISDPTNPLTIVVAAPTVPPVIPPVVPPVITTEVAGTWTLKKGTSNVLTGLATYQACKAAAESRATATATKYTCNVSNAVTVRK